jgi:hypothetical protein
VNAVLPLQIDPIPTQTTRVFVGRMELITPEIMQSAEAAIAANDPCLLDRYGRFLEPILGRIIADHPARATEVRDFRDNVGRLSSRVCADHGVHSYALTSNSHHVSALGGITH